MGVQKDFNARLEELSKMASAPKPSLSASRMPYAKCYSGLSLCTPQQSSVVQPGPGDIESHGCPTLLTQHATTPCCPSGAAVRAGEQDDVQHGGLSTHEAQV